MNYSLLFKNFKDEIFKPIQYKHLDQPFRAFAIVATLPFWLIYLYLLIVEYVCIFLFNCITATCDYLESWVKETKKDTSNITEAVLFLVAMPFIFFLRVIFSIFSSVFYLLWFLSMCVGYIASLGSIKWQPYINYASYEENQKTEVTTNKVAANVIIIIAFSLFCICALGYLLALIAMIVGNISLMSVSMRVANIVDYIFSLFMYISVPITFRKKIKCLDDGAQEAASDETGDVDTEENNGLSEASDDEFEEEFPDF